MSSIYLSANCLFITFLWFTDFVLLLNSSNHVERTAFLKYDFNEEHLMLKKCPKNGLTINIQCHFF